MPIPTRLMYLVVAEDAKYYISERFLSWRFNPA